jgi:hypothetical protein
VAACNVNLHRGLADVEPEHRLQRGVELLSAGEVILWWWGRMQENGEKRRWACAF